MGTRFERATEHVGKESSRGRRFDRAPRGDRDRPLRSSGGSCNAEAASMRLHRLRRGPRRGRRTRRVSSGFAAADPIDQLEVETTVYVSRVDRRPLEACCADESSGSVGPPGEYCLPVASVGDDGKTLWRDVIRDRRFHSRADGDDEIADSPPRPPALSKKKLGSQSKSRKFSVAWKTRETAGTGRVEADESRVVAPENRSRMPRRCMCSITWPACASERRR